MRVSRSSSEKYGKIEKNKDSRGGNARVARNARIKAHSLVRSLSTRYVQLGARNAANEAEPANALCERDVCAPSRSADTMKSPLQRCVLPPTSSNFFLPSRDSSFPLWLEPRFKPLRHAMPRYCYANDFCATGHRLGARSKRPTAPLNGSCALWEIRFLKYLSIAFAIAFATNVIYVNAADA